MCQRNVYSGFVVGSDLVGRNKSEVWKVRVNDKSELNNNKFEVATSHDLLTKGLEVDFIIGIILIGKRRVLKALEVKVKQKGVKNVEK